MRLILIIILFAIVQVSAATYAQKITYSKKDATLENVFKVIKRQIGYSVIYTEQNINVDNKVNVNFKNSSIEEVMDKLLAGLPLTYLINKKNIVIRSKETTFLEKMTSIFSKIDVSGRIIGENSLPLVGATISIKSTSRSVITDKNGYFTMANVDENVTLIISYLGYKPKEITAAKNIGIITLESTSGELKQVNVSTGYQTIPKERATGSFTTIDEKTINRSVSVNILDRLEGVASGLIFNRGLGGTNNSKISIHGRSTLFASPEPLIVLDGFPYDGTIDQINPIDIISINLLKDAAASSIWGSRSGNGVIVITTKKGVKNQKLNVGITSTLTIGDKPDLYYKPQMSSSDFIDLEQFLFNKGIYNSRLPLPYEYISPAVEIFNQRKLGKITSADSALRIDELKTYDVRRDIEKYVYRAKMYQQYGLNLSGGSETHRYYMSGGYDKNLENLVSDNYNRITLNASNTFYLFKDKLELSADVNYVSSNINTTGGTSNYAPYTPYDRLADSNGNPLPVTTIATLRNSYADTVANGRLLDWHYRPLDELEPNFNTRLNQYRIKAGINYKIVNGLNLMGSYQYLNETRNGTVNNDLNSYYTRNLINKYSSISNNVVNRVIPLGDILNESKGSLISKIIRAQLNFNRVINKDHEINAIAGYEAGDTRGTSGSQIYYGYSAETMINANATINPLNNYKHYYGPGSSTISTAATSIGSIDINQSYFTNLSYSYKNRYMLSGSIRRDESNLFGVETNQKGVPLWSLGFAWNVNQESFYELDWLPRLKLRATYGYNGNLDRTTSAFLATRISRLNPWASRYSTITNPANPTLRWERIKTWNLGIDFSDKNNRISGSIDVYRKKSDDLIGNSPIAAQSGVTQYRGNSANLQTKGIDFMLNSRNLTGELQWSSTFLLNYNTDKVTSYKVKQSSNSLLVSGNFNNPLEGYPYYAIFSLPSAGLDANGKVQGYLNGTATTDVSKILNIFDPGLVKYHGTASPKHFGSVINTLEYKHFELSFNVTYKFDYYFRRFNVFSGSNYGSATNPVFQLSNYENRWQKTGDELLTRVPGMIYPANGLQDQFYQYSEDLVEKGDHIRLQDIRFSYTVPEKITNRSPIKKASVFLYARNLGILWRANKFNIDPDYGTTTIPQPFSCSFGINISL